MLKLRGKGEQGSVLSIYGLSALFLTKRRKRRRTKDTSRIVCHVEQSSRATCEDTVSLHLTSNIMLSTRWKWVYLLCIFLSCCIEQSCGFQGSGAFGKRRNQHSHDQFQSSCVPTLTLESNGLSQVALDIRKVISNRYPFALRLSPLSIENAVLQSQRSPRYDISLLELRLHASPSDDEQSPPSKKFRSVLMKMMKGLTFPVVSTILAS